MLGRVRRLGGLRLGFRRLGVAGDFGGLRDRFARTLPARRVRQRRLRLGSTGSSSLTAWLVEPAVRQASSSFEKPAARLTAGVRSPGRVDQARRSASNALAVTANWLSLEELRRLGLWMRLGFDGLVRRRLVRSRPASTGSGRGFGDLPARLGFSRFRLDFRDQLRPAGSASHRQRPFPALGCIGDDSAAARPLRQRFDRPRSVAALRSCGRLRRLGGLAARRLDADEGIDIVDPGAAAAQRQQGHPAAGPAAVACRNCPRTRGNRARWRRSAASWRCRSGSTDWARR